VRCTYSESWVGPAWLESHGGERWSVSTDNGIIMARHRLMRAAKALVEKGETPPGVDPTHQRVRAVSIVLPPEQAFKDAAKEEMKVRSGFSHARV
jgi:phthalate 4,5-dioxygenase oxygenase subunit